jgi:tetratricopeptide (TPR) repeat protein
MVLAAMDEKAKQHLLLGREHYAKREFEKAEPLLREVLQHEDRFADVHDMLGVIAHLRGNLVAAEHHFERALAINPAYTEAALNLAVTYNDRGKYDAARDVYRRIRGGSAQGSNGRDPFVRGKLANMHAELASAYVDAGMPRDAILEYEKAIALCPNFADLRTRLGTLLREQNDLPRAREHYEAAIRAKPGYVPAHIQLGILFLAMAEPDRAQEHWERALELEPDNTQARMYLRTLQLRKESGMFKSTPPQT